MRHRIIRSLQNGRTATGAAMIGLVLIATIFAEFIAPYDPKEQIRSEPMSPRVKLRFITDEGKFRLRPFIYPQKLADPLMLRYEDDRTRTYPVGFFVRGYRYKLLGLLESDIHLAGVVSNEPNPPRLSLLGTDALGRDRFSRLLFAIRFSMIVAVLGALLACIIGIAVGIFSGYAGKKTDALLMSAADTTLSLPTLIVILAARAAFPPELPPAAAAFLLVTIFAAIGWAEIARLSRALVVSTREREFVLAARATGLSEGRILFRHILPNIAAPLITQATLIVPFLLIAEASLSFLGVGIQEPDPSIGNMLAAAADLTHLKNLPFEVLSPAAVLFLITLGIRLLADGSKRTAS
ncbi:ABC transporter permease [Leptolyngbya sp. 7M]|uniref:ABC transporter permease n=1 Tax=Leptolyngbya sp. 7M TaxID=2812896 RepID=UPI001B8CE97B|nr:ABC transporter permease [Leptolyngbya sp. 7M]QYO67628.1 ABC transporter permease [Leptolyngbya sp. 7M]